MCYHIASFLCCALLGHEACGVLAPWPGIQQPPPTLEGEVLTTGPQGKFHWTTACFWVRKIMISKQQLSIQRAFRAAGEPRTALASSWLPSKLHFSGLILRNLSDLFLRSLFLQVDSKQWENGNRVERIRRAATSLSVTFLCSGHCWNHGNGSHSPK